MANRQCSNMFQFLLTQKKRHILHIDADAFFASVEQVLNPNLKGKPILVGGPTETTGIVSAASYEAKRFGIYSGMPMYLAKRKCPQAIFVPGHFSVYRKFSKVMYEIFSKYTPYTEMASIDEAYLDLSHYGLENEDKPYLAAKAILMEVYKRLGISVSGGLATNKIVAKVASSQNKPHKLTVVPFGCEARFLAPLSLKALPGIGPRTFSVLERNGFTKVEDLASLSISKAMEYFGLNGIDLWKRSLGIDKSEVLADGALPKSISKENTFFQPIRSKDEALKFLKELSVTVFKKLRSHEMKAKTVFIKIRYRTEQGGNRPFADFSFQKHLGFLSSSDSELFPIVKNLFLEHLDFENPIRLIGMGVSNLVRNYNLSLFEDCSRKDKLFNSLDVLKKLYGEEVISYGGS